MERTTKLRQADAILCGDIHLRDNPPPCRTDNFEITQWNKLHFISNLQKKHDCPVLHSGDLFHHWKPSPYLISKALLHLPNEFYTIYGNHDLPQHNVELAEKCGIYALETAGRLTVLDGVHWGFEPDGDISFEIRGRKILIWHTMTYQGKTPYPGCMDTPAKGLLKKYKDYDLILTGHNHQQFTEEHDGRLLVNPGCMTRQESDQADFEPCVWLYFADTNTVQKVILPHEKGVVIKPEGVERIAERNERIEAFAKELESEWTSSINFEQNLERALAANPVEKEVEQIIYKAIED